MVGRFSLIVGLIALIALIDSASGADSPAAGKNSPASKRKSSECEYLDFSAFMSDLQKRIRDKWLPPVSQKDHRLTAKFKVYADGIISDIELPSTNSSELIIANHAAYEAVRRSSPVAKLPSNAQFQVDIEFTFDFKVNRKNNLQKLEGSLKTLKGSALAQAYRALGKAYADTGEIEKSKAAYKKSLDLSDSIFGAGSEFSALTLVSFVEEIYSKKKKYWTLCFKQRGREGSEKQNRRKNHSEKCKGNAGQHASAQLRVGRARARTMYTNVKTTERCIRLRPMPGRPL
ncbi:MAG: TonB C-terminal domain-containing protein [Candidatus Obscuribacterales bacterium]|nr:TonB C-terminal domain-containing protein [Candidatus Obscuribacterales bacterium]